LNAANIKWEDFPTPPRFVHQPNQKVLYFSLDYAKTNGHGNGHHTNGHANGEAQHFREKTLRCAAVGVPQPM
jgi:hypothetical protein